MEVGSDRSVKSTLCVISVVEAAVVETVLAAGKSLLFMMGSLLNDISALPNLTRIDERFPLDELHKMKRPDAENKDASDTENDGEDADDDNANEQDDDAGDEDFSGGEGDKEDDPEDDPEANGDGGSDDEDDDDDDDDDDGDEDDADEDGEEEEEEEEDEEEEEEVPQPPTKKRK